MIKIENITKSFGNLQVLKGIDMEVAKGEIVSIVGPSGAGKTTLLQIIGTLDRPDSGSVVIDGTEVELKENLDDTDMNLHRLLEGDRRYRDNDQNRQFQSYGYTTQEFNDSGELEDVDDTMDEGDEFGADEEFEGGNFAEDDFGADEE